MRILIISREAWRNDQNGGSTLTGMFSGFPTNTEYAQIYCAAEFPYNDICNFYYQLTTKMIAYKALHIRSEEPGIVIEKRVEQLNKIEDYGIKKNSRISELYNCEWMREIVWSTKLYKTNKLKKFIEDFNPDIIFAPCYGKHYMLHLTQWIASISQSPIISLISDDFYTMRQMRVSPFFWANHILLRKNVRKTMPLYSLVYTMTEEQKEQIQADFNVPVKIVCKSGDFTKEHFKDTVNNPIKFVYAGNLYYNRWKTLAKIAAVMKIINDKSQKMTLDIYTATIQNKKIYKSLNMKGTSFTHELVSPEELKKIYSMSDVALHIESLDIINREKVRFSFSTKIIDCLNSGCAVMAVCDKKQGGFNYLYKNNAAICVDSLDEIKKKLLYICDNKECLCEYQKRAWMLGMKNHDKAVINRQMYSDFCLCINNK